MGDDDQGLYRFRGATIQIFWNSQTKFEKDECKIVALTENYRSDSDIVDFYNKWMIKTDGSKFKFDWDKYRYEKRISSCAIEVEESVCCKAVQQR